MKYVLLILLVFVMSWREVQILIDRGSWKKEKLRFNPYWYIPQDKWYKNFDSFHVANGLAVLLILGLVIDYLFTTSMSLTSDILMNRALNLTISVSIYWVIIMQVRNLVMKLIYRR
jgi:glycopeptide antibiotics resistance protein